MTMPTPELERLLARMFDHYRSEERKSADPEEYEVWRRDFAFHMTDWLGDLERLSALFKDPKSFDTRQSRDIVVGFLIHAIPHLNQAGRLLRDEIPDIFIDDPRPPAFDFSAEPGPEPEGKAKRRAETVPSKATTRAKGGRA